MDPSTYTALKGQGDFEPVDYVDKQGSAGGGWSFMGRNLHFGVREHAMGGILNGIASHGGLVPYGSTFLIFSDYMRPPIRLAALTDTQVIYVFTHDSIGLGEDGPTHQPVEQLAGMRAMPKLIVIRPCDANETAEAWKMALRTRTRPTALILTRQNVPTLDRKKYAPASGLEKGAYISCRPRRRRSGNNPNSDRLRGAAYYGCCQRTQEEGDQGKARFHALLGVFRRSDCRLPGSGFTARDNPQDCD